MLSRPDAASSSPGGREGSRAALERRRVRPASTRTASCASRQKPSPSLSLRPAPPGGLEVGRSLCGEAAARVGRHPSPPSHCDPRCPCSTCPPVLGGG